MEELREEDIIELTEDVIELTEDVIELTEEQEKEFTDGKGEE